MKSTIHAANYRHDGAPVAGTKSDPSRPAQISPIGRSPKQGFTALPAQSSQTLSIAGRERLVYALQWR
jgi:hypothetical protein